MIAKTDDIKHACSQIQGIDGQINYLLDRYPQMTRRDAEREIRAYLLLESILDYYSRK